MLKASTDVAEINFNPTTQPSPSLGRYDIPYHEKTKAAKCSIVNPGTYEEIGHSAA